MEIIIEHGNEMTIKFSGRLDTVASSELAKKIEGEQIQEDKVVFDMKETEYISSAGLRLVISLKKDLSAKGKQFEIHNMNQVCAEVFRVSGFNKLIVIK